MLKVQSNGSSVIWNTGQTGDSVSVSGAGKYWAIHQTEEGCTSGASDTITVVVEPLPVVQLVASDNGHCLGNEETKEYKVISTNSKVKTVEVEGGEVVRETDSTLTVHWFEGTQTQAPWEAFSLIIKSQNRLGCAGIDLVFSPVPNPEACRELYPLFIPNLVTTNNDNHNERWEMGNILYHQPVSVRIYNRWGQTVFETDSYQNNWPNTSLSSGTYFYRVTSFGKEWKGWMEVK
jgi:gliding motility-associated-like protein